MPAVDCKIGGGQNDVNDRQAETGRGTWEIDIGIKRKRYERRQKEPEGLR